MAENAFKADWPSFALGFNTGKSKGGGGAELNIAYGTTAPEDTTKLWVKSKKPDKVRVGEVNFNEVLDYPYDVSKHYVGRACVAVGDKIYMFGGTGSGGSTVGTSTVYDTVTGETKSIQNMPRWGTRQRAVLVGDTIHVFAGANWCAYYYKNDGWGTISTSVPSDVQGSACCFVGGFVYFFGGGGSAKSTIYKLDLETNEFILCEAAFSSSIQEVSCVAIGTKIYLFGGKNSSGYSITGAACYDTTNDTLSDLKAMPVANVDMGCVTYDDEIILLGGYKKTSSSNTTAYLDQIMVYKPSVNEYFVQPQTLSEKRKVEGNVIIGDKVYLMGVATFSYKGRIEIYYIKPSVENGTLAVNSKLGTKIAIINAENLHVDTNICGAYMGDENGAGQPVEALMFKDGEWTNI